MRFKKMILMAALTTCALVFPFAGESKMFDIGMEYVCAETYEDYEYTVNVTSNKATITKYNGSAMSAVVCILIAKSIVKIYLSNSLFSIYCIPHKIIEIAIICLKIPKLYENRPIAK